MRVGNRLNRKVIRTVAKIPEPFVTGHIRASVTSSMRAPRDPHPHSFNGDLAVFHIVAHQPSGVLLLALPHRLSFLRHFRMSPGFRYRIVYPHVKHRINRKAIHLPSTGSLPTAPLFTGILTILGCGATASRSTSSPCLASRRLAHEEILPWLSIICGNPP